MKFEKGHKKKGGRQPGSVNKRTLAVRELAEKMNVDPFEILLKIAIGDHESLGVAPEQITLPLRLQAAADVAQYIAPKLKAIEHTDLSPEPKKLIVYTADWASDDESK